MTTFSESSNPKPIWLRALAIGLLMGFSFTILGCSDPDKPVVAEKKADDDKPKRVQRQIGPAGPGGPPPSGRQIGPAGPGGSRRQIGPADPGGAPAASNTTPGQTSVANMDGGLPNGLFPQVSASFSQNGFGGGLVPDFQNPADNSELSDSELTSSEPDNGFGITQPGQANDETSEVSTAQMTLLDRAQMAFRNRDESAGFKYLYAHYLTESGAQEKYPLNWYSGIKQPKVAFRWGVGVNYTKPRTFEGKPPVIGDPEDVRLPGVSQSNNSSGRGRGIGPSGGGGGAVVGTEASPYDNLDTSSPEGFLMFYTGDFGDRLLTQLEKHRTSDDAYFGAYLKALGMDYLKEIEEPAAASNNNRRRQGGGGGRSIGPSGGGGRSIGPSGGGRRSGSRPSGRNRRNSGGGDVIGSGSSGPSRSSGPASDRVTRVSTGNSSEPDSDLTGTLIPGVMLVGEAKPKVLLERAKEMGLDGLFVFSHRVGSGRRATGTTAVKVFNVHTGEEVFKSRSLISAKVAKARERNKSANSDPVQAAVDGIFKEAIDKGFRAKEMPALKPEHVLSRVKTIVKKPPVDPMIAAVEIVAFRQMDLLDSETAVSALDDLLGSGAGNAILAGDNNALKAILANYVPADDGDSDDGF